ncbi:hypothetical protein BASA83_011900 [Batrachochytrium salamandrivorans]|nr:hypothetical protein BASA83_011900 [Batrachochytrium salamandrivorans]
MQTHSRRRLVAAQPDGISSEYHAPHWYGCGHPALPFEGRQALRRETACIDESETRRELHFGALCAGTEVSRFRASQAAAPALRKSAGVQPAVVSGSPFDSVGNRCP